MTLITSTPDTVYLTKGNIVRPGTQAEATAAEVAARAEIATKVGVSSVTGGTIKRG